MRVGGQCYVLATTPPGKGPGTNFTEGSVGPRTGLDRCRKCHPQLRFDPQKVPPIASCYTVFTILGHLSRGVSDGYENDMCMPLNNRLLGQT